ncbi:hypothetical protein P152DRAFT_470421 [Eremomyces bilateralis CBS 781.70]|uniref:Uncharacterized protein n=1 Tax=Eremomyces bilateralis CBS 781.70 TaxID=1392243 RepID=A0A6G1GEE2_9PEZI|nr:uncharacterized protein P152DRAFT_470421 [Eremomyces bilateralis CBS 781.70]KAF1816394.1 hypothetical protein P152DRAFT_470421 [Eremomyces bilateralis CBS 781.70]
MEKVKKDASKFRPILQDLDANQVYLLHVDRHPVPHKKIIFFTAVLINLTVLALLIGRVVYVFPLYRAILLGREWVPDAQSSTTSIIIRRTFSLLIDSPLIQYAWRWPYTFFLERLHGQWTNPAAWRLVSDFRLSELVVRKSRNWGAKDVRASIDESPLFKSRVFPFASDRYLREKTGYLMQGKG